MTPDEPSCATRRPEASRTASATTPAAADNLRMIPDLQKSRRSKAYISCLGFEMASEGPATARTTGTAAAARGAAASASSTRRAKCIQERQQIVEIGVGQLDPARTRGISEAGSLMTSRRLDFRNPRSCSFVSMI